MGLMVGGSSRAGALTQKRNKLVRLKSKLTNQSTDIQYVVSLNESEIAGDKYDLEHQDEIDDLSSLKKILDNKKEIMISLLNSEINSLEAEITAEINANKEK